MKIKSKSFDFLFLIVWCKVYRKIVCNFGQWSMMRINCAIKLLNSLLIHHNNFLCLVLKSNFTHEGKLHIKWYKISSFNTKSTENTVKDTRFTQISTTFNPSHCSSSRSWKNIEMGLVLEKFKKRRFYFWGNTFLETFLEWHMFQNLIQDLNQVKIEML